MNPRILVIAAATGACLAALLAGCAGRQQRESQIIAVPPLDGLDGPVTAVVDIEGIPHIYADSRPDAAAILGWLHARDRFLQMDVARRSSLGTLSELVGPSAIEEDRLVRTLGLGRAAERAWNALAATSPEREIIVAYAAGVNGFLERARISQLPPYYADSELRPQPWRPIDCLAVSLRLALDASFSLDDIWLEVLDSSFGRDTAGELFPRPGDGVPAMVRHVASAESLRGPRVFPGAGTDGDAAAAGGARIETCRAILARYGDLPRRLVPDPQQSEVAWCVRRELTGLAGPVIGVSKRRRLTGDGPFYAAHLASPLLRVVGVTVPGLPAVVSGHNDAVAWNTSAAAVDATDFYEESFDPEDPERYRHGERWRRATTRVEEIRVRESDTVRLQVRETVHGPLIAEGPVPLSVRWSATALPGGGDGGLVSLLRVNGARSLQEFLDALRPHVAPPRAFLYADVEGNVALRLAGAVAVRHGDARRVFSGASGEHDWLGTIPFEEMPWTLNPPEGYVIAANQAVVASEAAYPYYIGWRTAPGFRARRVEEILSEAWQLTLADFVSLQRDVHDTCLRKLVDPLVEAFADEPPEDLLASLCLKFLESWSFQVRAEMVEPTLADAWLHHLEDAVWSDEWEQAGLGRAPTRTCLHDRGYPSRDVLVRICTQDGRDARWFDNVSTNARETRRSVLRTSFLRAVEDLRERFGPSVAGWRWGQRNRLRFVDPIDRSELEGTAVPAPGNRHTICMGEEGGSFATAAALRAITPLGELFATRIATPGPLAAPARLAADSRDNPLALSAEAFVDGRYASLAAPPNLGRFPRSRIDRLLDFHPRQTTAELESSTPRRAPDSR